MQASWAVSAPEENFTTSLEVDCRDRDNLLLDIAMAMSAMKIPISEINCRTVGEGRALASLTFSVKTVVELNTVCSKIRSITGVEQVRRGKS